MLCVIPVLAFQLFCFQSNTFCTVSTASLCPIINTVCQRCHQICVNTFSVISSSYDRSMATFTLLALSSDILRRFVTAGNSPTIARIKLYNPHISFLTFQFTFSLLFFFLSSLLCPTLLLILSAGVQNQYLHFVRVSFNRCNFRSFFRCFFDITASHGCLSSCPSDKTTLSSVLIFIKFEASIVICYCRRLAQEGT